MNDIELIEKNNIILSHNRLPKGMTICENYGLSGNCGSKCPLFKNKKCEVYEDVLERINNQLQSNWNSLREYLKNREEVKYYITEYRRYEQFINDILDKMNELEGKDNNE